MKRIILFVVPSISSCDAFLTELFEGLLSGGFDVHLVCSSARVGDTDSSLPRGVIVHSCNIPRGFSFLQIFDSCRRIRQILREVDPSIIHGHFVIGALLAAICGVNSRRRTIVTFHGLHSGGGLLSASVSLVERCAGVLADEIEVLTEDDYKRLARIPMIGEKVRALGVPGVGCRLPEFDSGELASESETLRRGLGIDESAPVFIFVGRAVAFKGYASAVRAFRKYRDVFGAGYLIILGANDPLHDDGLEPEERKWRDQCPGVKQVGWQPNVGAWMNLGTVLLFPSVREGLPVCVMEAMAVGLPVIAVDTRGCRDLISDRQNGILLESASDDSLFDAMKELVQDVALRKRLAEGSREYAAQYLSRDIFVERQCKVYERMLSLL